MKNALALCFPLSRIDSLLKRHSSMVMASSLIRNYRLLFLYKEEVRHWARPVVLNLSSIEPMGFGQSVSMDWWFGSLHSYYSCEIRALLVLFFEHSGFER